MYTASDFFFDNFIAINATNDSDECRIDSGKKSAIISTMEKITKEPTKPLQLRLPSSVFDRLEQRYRASGVDKQLQALAGIIAIESLDLARRNEAINFATRISLGEISMDEVVDLYQMKDTGQGYSDGLIDALRQLERDAVPTKTKRRRASGQ